MTSSTDSKSKVTVTKEPTNPITGEKVTHIQITSKGGPNQDTTAPVIELQRDSSSTESRKTTPPKKNPGFFKRVFYSGWVSSQVFIITALTFVVALAWDNAFVTTFQGHTIGIWLYPIVLTIAVVILSIITDIGIKKIKEKHPTVKYYY